MAKKTVYGTGLTIRQIKSILKKTEQLEKMVANKENIPPDMIMISYSAAQGNWCVYEDFMTGKKILQDRITKEVQSLQDYVFQGNFYGQVLLDLMDHPEGNIFSFNVGLFRVENGIMNKAFSLEFVADSGNLYGEFDLTIYENRKEKEHD